jgi:hypothetical protein
MDDSQVPVHAHESDEEHAAEEANVVKTRDHLAHARPEHPLVQLIVGLKGEGKDKEQVRQGQVQEVYVCDAPQLLVGHKDQDDQAVSQKSKYKQKTVEYGQQQLAVSLDKFPIAGAWEGTEIVVVSHCHIGLKGIIHQAGTWSKRHRRKSPLEYFHLKI